MQEYKPNSENPELVKDPSVEKKEEKKEEGANSETVMTNEKRIEKATVLKDQARKFVDEKDYVQAIKLYEQALMVCHPSYFAKSDAKLVKEMINLTNMLLNNLSLCYFNIKDYQKSLGFAEQVLLTDAKNVKSFYRKAVCYKSLGDLERAFMNIKEAKKICIETNQNNASIFQEYDVIKVSYQEYLDQHKEKEKLLYSKMLSTKKDEKPQETSNLSSSPKEKQASQNKEEQDSDEHLENIVNSFIVLPTSLLGMVLCHYVFKMKLNEGKLWLTTALMTGAWSGTILSKSKWLKALFALISLMLPAYFYKKAINF